MDYEKICEALRGIAGPANVLREEPMSGHTTFRVGGPAKLLVTPAGEDLARVLACCRRHRVPFEVIGNGSNLLVGDGGIDGVVIEIGKQMAGIAVRDTEIEAEAGALLSSVSAAAAAAGLTGLEFASGIPGSIGGAVVMNAGAYGGEMKDVLAEARVLTPEGEVLCLPPKELDLSYRHSNVPEKGYVVLGVRLKLAAGEKEKIRTRMEELKEARVSKQPLEYPSAGSTFKRPQGHFAGALIEEAGLRGFSVGGAQVSEKHCGFVINRDGATAADVRSLMEQVRERVKERSGVTLEPEVKFLGNF